MQSSHLIVGSHLHGLLVTVIILYTDWVTCMTQFATKGTTASLFIYYNRRGTITPDTLCADCRGENLPNIHNVSKCRADNNAFQVTVSIVLRERLVAYSNSPPICHTKVNLNNLRIMKHSRRACATFIMNSNICIGRGKINRYIELRICYQREIFRTSAFF